MMLLFLFLSNLFDVACAQDSGDETDDKPLWNDYAAIILIVVAVLISCVMFIWACCARTSTEESSEEPKEIQTKVCYVPDRTFDERLRRNIEAYQQAFPWDAVLRTNGDTIYTQHRRDVSKRRDFETILCLQRQARLIERLEQTLNDH